MHARIAGAIGVHKQFLRKRLNRKLKHVAFLHQYRRSWALREDDDARPGPGPLGLSGKLERNGRDVGTPLPVLAIFARLRFVTEKDVDVRERGVNLRMEMLRQQRGQRVQELCRENISDTPQLRTSIKNGAARFISRTFDSSTACCAILSADSGDTVRKNPAK